MGDYAKLKSVYVYLYIWVWQEHLKSTQLTTCPYLIIPIFFLFGHAKLIKQCNVVHVVWTTTVALRPQNPGLSAAGTLDDQVENTEWN